MSYLINTLLHPLSIFLGVLLIFVGVVGYYFNNKLREQNLKIDSIASVVSTMAMEMRNIHGGNLNTAGNTNDKYINLNTSNLDNELPNKHSLINVSDSDENSSSDEDSSYESESESDGYETDGTDETLDEDDNCEVVKNENNNKILKHDYESLTIDENIIVLKIDTPLFNIEENVEKLDTHDIEEIENVQPNEESHNYYDTIENEVKDDHVLENMEIINFDTEQLSQNNSIDLDKDNVEILLKNVEVDYKKMTLTKLKEIALEKGLIDETTKLKKQDLLKLLSN